ncbi:MAG: gluconate 2-dehydrogenase subunit 3 family protein [Woeseiaceae bacterium]
MTIDANLSRRAFLGSAGSLTTAAWLCLTSPALSGISRSARAARAEAAFKVLAEREAIDFAAIAARLIPTTDTPGATEAGVVYFMDTAFATEMADRLDEARSGLRTFNRQLSRNHPSASSLTDLAESDQDAFLATQQDSDFFGLVRLMTLFGFLSMEKYGGNRDRVGWKLINFEGGHHAWQYPFGYYDAQVHGGDGD